MSSQYSRECATANLDSNIMGQLKKVLNNLKEQSPDNWFTKDLDLFLQTQNTTEINQTEYDKWIFNAKVMYLVTQEHNIQKLNLPSTTSSQFIPALGNIQPKSPFLNILAGKNKKAKVDKRIAKLPPQDSRLSYCFNLNLNECGEKTERSIFEKLISLKNNETLQDIVVLSSPNFMTEVTSKKHQEFDMLIFSWTRKLIIGVEVKRTLTNNTTAFEQLNKYHSILEKQLGDQLGPGWSFVPVLCVEKNNTKFSNYPYYIDLNTDLETWLSDVFNKCSTSQPLQTSLQQLKKILQIIVFSIHLSTKDKPKPITTSYLFDYVRNAIDSLSTARNIVFYSKQQLPVISSNDPCFNKIIFMAGFGTGKTFLLREKVMILSKDDLYKGRILYVVCNGEGLLYHDRKTELEQQGITVVTGKSAIESLKIPWIRRHFKAIVFDEWSENYEKEIDLKWLDNFPVCWIAPNSSYRAKAKVFVSIKTNFKGFEVIQLHTNLRNTKEIVEKTKNIAETQLYKYVQGVSETPVNFLTGDPPIYVSSIGEAVFKASSLRKKGLLIVTDTIEFPIPPSEPIKFYHLSRNDFDENNNPCDYLSQGNILVTSRNYVSGFECPVVIYENDQTVRENLEHHECNISMRCTTQLIIVGQNYDSSQALAYFEIANLLQHSMEDSALLSQFKVLTMNYIIDYVKQFARRDILTNILHILKITLKDLTEFDEKNFSAESISKVLHEFLTFIVDDLVDEQSSNQDFSQKTLKVISLLIMNVFCNCKNIEQTNNKLRRFLSFKSLVDSFEKSKSGLANYFDFLERFLELDFQVFFLQPNNDHFMHNFKIYFGEYIVDHFLHFGETDWLLELSRLLEWTFRICSQAKHANSLSKREQFSLLENIIDFVIEDLVKRQKNIQDDELCRTFVKAYFTVDCISRKNKYVLNNLNFKYLLELSADFDISKLSRIIAKRNLEFEISFWKEIKHYQLHVVLQSELDLLNFQSRDSAFSIMFKLYAAIYLRDHCNYYNKDSEWLKEIKPILESTLQAISILKPEVSPKFKILSILNDYLNFITSDIIKRHAVTANSVVDKMFLNTSIDDKRFLIFSWLRNFILSHVP
eukprot:TCONS_00034520-protein